MTWLVIGQDEVWAIAYRFAKDVEAFVGEYLFAVVLVGTLASGHYVLDRSDIDLIAVLAMYALMSRLQPSRVWRLRGSPARLAP